MVVVLRGHVRAGVKLNVFLYAGISSKNRIYRIPKVVEEPRGLLEGKCAISAICGPETCRNRVTRFGVPARSVFLDLPPARREFRLLPEIYYSIAPITPSKTLSVNKKTSSEVLTERWAFGDMFEFVDLALLLLDASQQIQQRATRQPIPPALFSPA